MVQYKITIHRSNYWKLCAPASGPGYYYEGKVELQQKIDRIGGERRHWAIGANIARLRELVHRTLRGLRCYDGDSKALLKTFCSQRRLPNDLQKATKETLIQSLEAADEKPTFTRFLDLPPELRVFIYELHCGSLPEYATKPSDDFRRGLRYPAPPPITQISSLIRRESLLCFFQVPTFSIEHARITRAVLEPEALQWLRIMPQEMLATIRHLTILAYDGDVGETVMRLDMGAGQGGPTLEGSHTDEVAGNLIPWDPQSEIHLQAQDLVKGLHGRSKSRRLLITDIEQLLGIYNDYVWSYMEDSL